MNRSPDWNAGAETVRIIRAEPGISQAEVARRRGVNRVSVHLQVKQLAQEGVIIVQRAGNQTKLYHVEDWVRRDAIVAPTPLFQSYEVI